MVSPGQTTKVAGMRDPAPAYDGEGPHALRHVSENAAIEQFDPHVSATAESDEAARLGGRHSRPTVLLVPSRVPARDVLGASTWSKAPGSSESAPRWSLWDRVAASTLEFSGIRLHNAQPRNDR